jgi:hypothetical protein
MGCIISLGMSCDKRQLKERGKCGILNPIGISLATEGAFSDQAGTCQIKRVGN